MKCPHCTRTGKMRVQESRPHDGNVYRRRLCACGKSFVTVETASAGLTMGVAMKLLKYSAARKSPCSLGDMQARKAGKHQQPLKHEIEARRYDGRTNKAALELAGIWNKK